MDVTFNFIKIDGQNIDLNATGYQELPANQGKYIKLGIFRNGAVVSIEWSFRTGVLVDPLLSIVGAFRYSSQDASRFKTITLDTFTDY